MSSQSRLYRCRAKVLYKFYASDLAVVIDEKQIQDLQLNLGWDPNTTTLNSEVPDADIMSFTSASNTCSVTISDPYLTGLAWPSLTDVAGAAIGAISYQSSGIVLPPCKEGETPGNDKCWNYELLDLTRMQPKNNANAQLSNLVSNYSQQALIMVALWYEAHNGYTFGTDYLFKVSGATVSHGKDFPTVTLSGRGNFGVTFQDRLLNVSVDNTVEVEQALKDLAEKNNFNLEFCVADYDTENKLDRKVIKSNLTIKQLLDDIVKTQKGGEYLSLPTKEMYNTLHVCTRADTWPGCSVFYLGKPLYEGYKVSALIDSTVLGRNQEFTDSSPASRASRQSSYLTGTDAKDSAWEIVTRDKKNTFDISKYEYTSEKIKVEFKSTLVKALEGTWKGFKQPRETYFVKYNEKLPFLELQKGSGQSSIVRKVVHEKVNPGVIGQWNTNSASAIYSGKVTDINDTAEGKGKKITVKTDYVLYLRGVSTRNLSRLTVFVDISGIVPIDDVKADYKTELGAPIGQTFQKGLQNMSFYVINNNSKQYLAPDVVLEYAVPQTFEPEIGNPPEELISSSLAKIGHLISDIAKEVNATPEDMAALISLVTNGTFNPNLASGENKQFQGWVRFDSDERNKYNVRRGQSVEDHANAVLKFFKDASLPSKPSLYDLYKVVYDAQIKNNEVDSKIKNGKHREKAKNVLEEAKNNPEEEHDDRYPEPTGTGEGEEDENEETPAQGATTGGTVALRFKWPVDGVISSHFGRRWGRQHEGIDIAGNNDKPIYAAAPGEVVQAGWNSGGYGYWVKIKHGDSGYSTVYAHMIRTPLVKKGDKVSYDTQLGNVGTTGRSDGPHLHFEIISPNGRVSPDSTHKGTTSKGKSYSVKRGTDTNLYQPGDGTTIKFDGVSVSPGGQGASNAAAQTAPGRGTGFTIETEFKGVPRALRILPKFTILSLVTEYQDWINNNLSGVDPGVWVPNYFKNWLIRTVQFLWNEGDLRVKINAMSTFGIDTKDLVPSWKAYSEDLKANGFYSSYTQYIRSYGHLCWNDEGKPSCHTRCSVTEDFMLAAQSGSTSVSSADVSSLSGCQLEPGKLNLSAEDEKLLFQITAAEAGGEGPLGMALVLRSILIRKLVIEKHKINYGTTSSNLRDIIYAGNGSQYEPVRSNRRPIDGNYEVHKADYEKAKTMAFDYDALRKQGISNELLASPNFRSSSKNVPLADNWIDKQGYIYKGHRFGIDTEISKKWTVQQTLEAFSERYGKCTRTGTTTTATSEKSCAKPPANGWKYLSKKSQSWDWKTKPTTAGIPQKIAIAAGHNNLSKQGAQGEPEFNVMVCDAIAKEGASRGITVDYLKPSQSNTMSLAQVLTWLKEKKAAGYYAVEIHGDRSDAAGRSGVIAPRQQILEPDQKLAAEFGAFPYDLRPGKIGAVQKYYITILETAALYDINKLSDAQKKEAAAEIAKRFFGAIYDC